MSDLTPLTDCSSEEEVCETPAEVNAGDALLTVDPTTKCNRLLTNVPGSIPVGDGNEVRHRTGSKTDQIILPGIMEATGSFPRVMTQNAAGALMQLKAPQDCRPHAVVGKEGSFNLQLLEQNSCWKEICACNPQQLAGFIVTKDCNGVENYCLVRFPLDDIVADVETLFFASTSCIQKNGTGTEGDPYKFSPKISQDANNCLECRPDGLYVQCGIYSGSDPIDEL